jgi:rhodanese-related sulfurtransferase
MGRAEVKTEKEITLNSLNSVPQVDAKTAYEQWQQRDVALLDVRERSEWDLGHIEGIEFIPLGQLPWRWRELNPSKKWICVCLSGARSNYAAALLRQAGIDASNLRGGMLDWKANNLPITPPGIVEAH